MHYLSIQCCRNIVREPNVKHVNYFISVKTICFKNIQCHIYMYVLFSLQTRNSSPKFNSLHHWTKSCAQKFGLVRFDKKIGGSARVWQKLLVRSFPNYNKNTGRIDFRRQREIETWREKEVERQRVKVRGTEGES